MANDGVEFDWAGYPSGTGDPVLDTVRRRLRAFFRPLRPKAICNPRFPHGFLILADDRLLCDIGADRGKKRDLDNWINAILLHGL